MALLRGRNYDYSGEVTAFLTQNSFKENTSLYISNTTGINNGDFIVISPKTPYAEIVQVTEDPETSKLIITALKFNHRSGDFIYRVSYNQMRFYGSTEESGPFTNLIDTVDMNYTDNYTNHYYEGPYKFFKRTFYNSEESKESDIALGDTWVTSDEDLIITEQELRSFLQFEVDDWPSANDLRFFIKTATIRLNLDSPSRNPDYLFIGALLISKSYVLRALATKAIAKGYIQVNTEGRTVTKAYQEIVLEAERVHQEYKEFMVSIGRREATSTKPISNTNRATEYSRQEIINILNSGNNAQNIDFSRRYSYFWGRR